MCHSSEQKVPCQDGAESACAVLLVPILSSLIKTKSVILFEYLNLSFYCWYCSLTNVFFPLHSRLYVWEIMTSTLKKMSKHTNKVPYLEAILFFWCIVSGSYKIFKPFKNDLQKRERCLCDG